MQIENLLHLKMSMQKAFCADTAYCNMEGATPSAGHCAIVAEIVREMFGGDVVSCNINGMPHRYNFINGLYVDLTGDQFGLPSVCLSASPIYDGVRHRKVKNAPSRKLKDRIQRFCARMS